MERNRADHYLSFLLSKSIYDSRLGQMFIGGYPEIPRYVDPLDWLPREVYWLGLLVASGVLFKTLMFDGDPPVP
jgi:hypothetical protein